MCSLGSVGLVRLARAAGALFSLGHGAVVVAVALAAGSLSAVWETPRWLEIAGVAVSIAFLFGLAVLNVSAVLRSAPDTIVAPAGFRSRWLARVVRVDGAFGVAGVGAMFAISFDTVSQAALFALAAARFGGTVEALYVALLFVVGMLAVDGINGAWINRLIRRADRTARIASRVMALSVAGISVTVGLLALARLSLPAVEAWAAGHAHVVSAAVMIGALTAFAAAMIAAPRRVRV